jgi:hypothetical protein
MSEDNHQEKNQEKNLPRESLEEFSKRVGLKYVREKGGQEFTPYHSSHLSKPKPKQSSKD